MTAPPPGAPEGSPAGGPTTGGSDQAVCYRHPGRETYIRCARCERPICPDCMNSAPVGFQCPECVREGHVATRTRIGATASSRPYAVTLGLIALNVLIYLVEQTQGLRFQYTYAEVGPTPCASGCGTGIADGGYYRLVTAMFLHVNIFHIALNMYALYWLGRSIEPQLGWWRFLGLYLAAGIAGNVVAYVVAPNSLAEGASGAIYGLFAAMWIVARRIGLDTSQITAVIGLNLVLSFVIARISWQAHVGGLVAGALIALVLAYTPRGNWRPLAHGAAIVAVAAVALIAALLKTSALG
jgi:membrane associated rhomboid family serine protease